VAVERGGGRGAGLTYAIGEAGGFEMLMAEIDRRRDLAENSARRAWNLYKALTDRLTCRLSPNSTWVSSSLRMVVRSLCRARRPRRRDCGA
jgi:hypothetical protein